MKNNFHFICVVLFVLNGFVAVAQPTLPDSAVLKQAIANAQNTYKRKMQENLRLYNGYQYVNSSLRAVNVPFWGSDSFTIGNIQYDNSYYEQVPMKYDLVNQNVVIVNAKDQSQISLVNEKISSFELTGHHFIMLRPEKINASEMEPGFYDCLYSGNTTVWARRTKKYELPQKAEEQNGNFKETAIYYIQVDNNFYPVSSKRDVLKALKNKSDAVNQFIKSNDLSFKKDLEQTLIKVVTYFDHN